MHHFDHGLLNYNVLDHPSHPYHQIFAVLVHVLAVFVVPVVQCSYSYPSISLLLMLMLMLMLMATTMMMRTTAMAMSTMPKTTITVSTVVVVEVYYYYVEFLIQIYISYCIFLLLYVLNVTNDYNILIENDVMTQHNHNIVVS